MTSSTDNNTTFDFSSTIAEALRPTADDAVAPSLPRLLEALELRPARHSRHLAPICIAATIVAGGALAYAAFPADGDGGPPAADRSSTSTTIAIVSVDKATESDPPTTAGANDPSATEAIGAPGSARPATDLAPAVGPIVIGAAPLPPSAASVPASSSPPATTPAPTPAPPPTLPRPVDPTNPPPPTEPPTTVPVDTVEFTVEQTFFESDADPPYEEFYGTAKAGSRIAIGSPYSERVVVYSDADGNWSARVEFPNAPVDESFTGWVKASEQGVMTFTFTRL